MLVTKILHNNPKYSKLCVPKILLTFHILISKIIQICTAKHFNKKKTKKKNNSTHNLKLFLPGISFIITEKYKKEMLHT